MSALAPADLAALVRRHFPQGQVTAYAIARAESGGRPEAVGDAGQSIGIWQIYLPAHPAYSRAALFDPEQNATAAAAISSGGTNFNPWCTWERSACGGRGNASYRAYLAEAQAALAVPTPPPPPPPTPPPAADGAALGLWLALAGAGALLVYRVTRRPGGP